MQGFLEFWIAYPKKLAKGDAKKAWKKVKAKLPVILESIQRHKQTEQWQKDNGQWIPYPASFLRAEMWEDEIEPLNPKFTHAEIHQRTKELFK